MGSSTLLLVMSPYHFSFASAQATLRRSAKRAQAGECPTSLVKGWDGAWWGGRWHLVSLVNNGSSCPLLELISKPQNITKPQLGQQLRFPLSQQSCVVSIQTRQKQIKETKRPYLIKNTRNQCITKPIRLANSQNSNPQPLNNYTIYTISNQSFTGKTSTIAFPPTQKTSMSFTRTIWLVTLSSFTATPWRLVTKSTGGW